MEVTKNVIVFARALRRDEVEDANDDDDRLDNESKAVQTNCDPAQSFRVVHTLALYTIHQDRLADAIASFLGCDLTAPATRIFRRAMSGTYAYSTPVISTACVQHQSSVHQAFVHQSSVQHVLATSSTPRQPFVRAHHLRKKRKDDDQQIVASRARKVDDRCRVVRSTVRCAIHPNTCLLRSLQRTPAVSKMRLSSSCAAFTACT